jgi:hypothetical protein
MQKASSMTATKVLNTYALIAFFEDEPGADFVRSILLLCFAGSHLTKKWWNTGET